MTVSNRNDNALEIILKQIFVTRTFHLQQESHVTYNSFAVLSIFYNYKNIKE